MNILENELIKKYFGRGKCEIHPSDCEGQLNCMAYRVLQAMQEPLKKGEKYLGYRNNSEWVEDEAGTRFYEEGFHGYSLRLPDSFQPRREKCCDVEKYFEFTADGMKAKLCPTHFEAIRKAIQPSPAPEREPTQIDRLNGVGCGCCPCHHDETCKWYKKPSPTSEVEAKLKQLEGWHKDGMASSYHYELVGILRTLFDLVRKEKYL